MKKLEDFYNRIASEYEDLTVKLSLQVDSIIFSIRTLEKPFTVSAKSIARTSNITSEVSGPSPTEMIQHELKDLIEALTSLKEMVNITLASVIQATNIFTTQTANDINAYGQLHEDSCQKSMNNFKNTLAKCISVLEELDKDLFNTEITLVQKNLNRTRT